MRKIHKGKIPLFSKWFGLKNGPDNLYDFQKGLRLELINKEKIVFWNKKYLKVVIRGVKTPFFASLFNKYIMY